MGRYIIGVCVSDWGVSILIRSKYKYYLKSSAVNSCSTTPLLPTTLFTKVFTFGA